MHIHERKMYNRIKIICTVCCDTAAGVVCLNTVFISVTACGEKLWMAAYVGVQCSVPEGRRTGCVKNL